MNERFKDLAPVVGFIGTILVGFHTLMEWSGLPAYLGASYGEPIKILYWVVSTAALIGLGVVFLQKYELMGAGADAVGTSLRDDFDKLRANLEAHKDTEDAYATRLKAFLSRVDKFFGDTGEPTQHAILLREPAHLWTAPAVDRCLLLALIYPVLAIFVIWMISGEVGPAEQILGLKAQIEVRDRYMAILGLSFSAYALWRMALSAGSRRVGWGAAAFACALVGAFTFALPVAFAFAFGFAIGVVFTFVGFGAGAGAASVAVAVAAALALIGVVTPAGVLATLAAAATSVALGLISKSSQKGRWQKQYLLAFIPLAILLCLAGARYLPRESGNVDWALAGPFLLFLGLMTLINAPFDWLSLGLTRLLLRYGIEKGGPWPWVLAVVDALVASALIILLAIAMVVATDLFNYLAYLGGGDEARVLPPMQFYLSMLRAAPRETEFWWLYATLFSTMLPSVINLFIAGFSFLRGLPQTRAFLLHAMRPDETMPAATRFGAALVLAGHSAMAATFAVGAQAFLAWVVLRRLLPWLGADILEVAEKFAM